MQKYREKVFLEIIRNDNKIFLIIVLFTILYFIGNYTSFVTVSGHAIPIASKPRPNQIVNSTASIPDKISITFNERPDIGCQGLFESRILMGLGLTIMISN